MSNLPDPERAPYNPYAPPGSPPGAPGPGPTTSPTRIAVPGESLKWIYGVLAGLTFLVFAAILFAPLLVPNAAKGVTAAMVVLEPILRLGKVVIGLMWLHAAWTTIPLREREGTSPGRAVGYLFVPLFNLAWMFMVQTRLANAIDSLLMRGEDKRRTPLWMAYLALFAGIVGTVMSKSDAAQYAFVTALVANGAWLAYMIGVDPLRRAVWERHVRREDE